MALVVCDTAVHVIQQLMLCHIHLADRLSGAQSEPAQKEVLALTVKVLTKVFPDRFQLQESTLSNVATGAVFDVADTCTNPMDTIARLVQVLLSYLFIYCLFVCLLLMLVDARCVTSCSDLCAVMMHICCGHILCFQLHCIILHYHP